MKHLNFLSKTRWLLVPLMLITFGIGQMWGADVTCTLTNTNIVDGGAAASGYASKTMTDGCSQTWNAYAIKNKHSNATSSYHFLQIRAYNNPTAYYLQVPARSGYTIKSITMVVSNTSQPRTGGGNSATLFFSSSNSTSAAGTGVASGTGTSSVTIDCSSLGLATGYITASGAVRIWGDVSVTYTPSQSGKSDLSDAQFGWSAASATVTKDANDNVYPTLYNTLSLAKTFQSTDETVATIAANGTISLLKAGSTTIKAVFAGNDTYNAKTVSYTLTVNKPAPTPIEGGIVDELKISTLGVTGSGAYSAFSGKQASNTGHSSAVYAGTVARNGNSTQYNIQLNSGQTSNKLREIATSTSGGLAKRVYVTWATQSTNTASRKLTIYGQNEAYTGSETEATGTALGDIVYAAGDVFEYLDITGNYKYIQIVANNAIYMDEIDITWVAPPTYAINKVPTGCTLTVKKGNDVVTSAAEGDEISVSATASTGYNTPNITVKDAQNNNIPVTNGKFTMPAKAVTVTATASMTDYTVTVNKNPAISATTTGQTTTAHYDGTINLTTTVPSGYAFVNWTTTDGFSITNATTTTASFTMPAKNVTVTANFRKLVQSITVKNGETNISGQIIEMTVGDEINLSVDFTPSDAYDKSLTWTSGDDTKATLSNGTLTAVAATTSNVTMTVSTPDLVDPVTFYVKVNEPEGNTVTLTQPTLGGTIDASPKGEVDEGDEVTLSYTALSTHEFVAWIVKDEDNADVTVTNNKFTMPDKSVTVTASFRPKAPVFTLAAGSYEGNQVVKLTSFDGDHFLYYYTLDGTDPDDNSTSYDDNTTGIVLSASKTLKMIIYDEEIQASAITTAAYTITHTPSVLTLSANGNTYTFDQDNTHYLNEVVQLPNDIPNNYKIAGKVFKGWSSVAITTPSAGQPENNFYQPEGDYTLSTTAPTLYAVYATEKAGATTWNEIALGSLGTSDVFVIVGNNGSNYAMTNDNGTSNPPAASAVTIANSKITSTVTDNLKWNISGNATDGYTFYPNGSTTTWLYCTNTNNGVRVGAGAAKQFTINQGYLYETATSDNRFIGIYNSQDWRCYAESSGNPHTNISGQSFKYYKATAGPASYEDYVTTVATYAITEATCENGEVEADVTTATAGATITISATPNEGYALLAFDVYKTGASATKVDFTVDENDYKVATFTMPAYAVTVSATFIKVGTASNPLTVAELQASKADLVDYYVYAQGIVSELGSLNNGKYTYYFSADGSTTNQFQVYKGYKGSHQVEEVWYYDGFENASDLAVGDEVIVEGYIAYYNNTTYQFSDSESELTSHCRPVVVTKGAETASEGTYTLTSGGNALSAKYCLADLSEEDDLTVTVTASPQEGYRLKAITSKDANNQTVGTIGAISNNVCTITGIKASTTITATFEQIYSVALSVSSTGTTGECSATINGGAGPVVVTAGETINLVASLTDTENDEFVSFTATTGITITPTGDLTATATATQNGTITATFRALPDPHTITNAGVSATYGTITMKDLSDQAQSSMSMRPDKIGKLVATETEGYRFLSWTVTPANAVTFADATSLETTFTAKDVDASISANYEARTPYTVRFMNGNTQIGTDATVYDGRTINLLGAQTSFDTNHTRFCGWAKNSFDGIADAEPSFVSGAQTIDGNTTFYAVYGNAVETNNYGKITEAAELESGKNYLIVAEYNSGLEALHAAELSKEYWLKTGVVTADNNIIASTDAERTWQISVNAGVAHVYNEENEKYLGVNYVSSGDHYNARIFDEAYDLTIAPNAGAWNISGVSNTKTVYVIHAPGYQEYIGSNAAAPVYLYKQLYESDEWVSLPVEYVNVTFDKNAGSETVTNMPANITNQMKGYSLTAPSETPARGGYNFIGWNTDNEATVAMSFPQTINTNTTVYAIWQAYPDCAIDLYVNGVKDENISTAVKQGAELDLSAIDAPERLGYEFLGWAAAERAEENTTAIDIVETYTPTPNEDTQKSFYAVYTRQEGESQYEKVTSEPTDWSGKYLIVCENQNIAFDGSLTSLDVAGNNFEVTIDDDVIAYSAAIDAKTFTIAAVTGGYSIQSESGYYICGKGSGNNGMNSSDSEEYVNTISLTNEDNATIIGDGAYMRCNANNGNPWFRYFKSTTYTSQDPIQLYKYIAGTTYYTTNPAVNYNVSYNLAGGAWKEDEGCESAIVAANGSYDVCEDVPVKTDYIFTGWTVGGEAVGASITVTGTTVILANYREAETYSVTYNANGALGTAPAATPVKEGANHTVLGNTWFFKAGYSFAGWNTAADGTGTKYAKDAVMTMPSENVTLYAQWSNSLSERDVVIVAHYGDKYYAMGQTLSSGQLNAVQVQMLNGKVRDVAEANRAAITWRMIVNSSNNTVSFYSPVNEKYLGAGSSTNLALSEDAVEWIWDSENKCYKIGEGARTFWYRNTESGKAADYYNYFKYFSISGSVGQEYYASEMILAYGFAVTIDDDATESALTVGDDVVVTEDATLTINSERVLNSLTVENGGKVQIAENKELVVQDFFIAGTHGQSGQVSNAENLHINGDAYFDFTLGVDVSTTEGAAKAESQWHNFSVPFPVDAMTGVFDAANDAEHLTNEVDYAIEDYHGELRKNGEYGWKKFRGIMTPGHTYSMTVNGDIQTYRFKKVAGDYTFDADPTVGFSQHAATGSGTSSDAGWNGLGNMRLCYSSINNTNIAETTPEGQSTGRYVLVLNAEDYRYDAYLLSNINLTVGSAFFIQASADGTMGFNDAQGGAGKIYAPARTQAKMAEPIMVTMSGERGTDHMYISADEDATSTYQIGRDMQRMFATSNPTTPLIYTMNYGGLKLAAEDAPMVNDQAVYTLQLYAPIAGEYTLQTGAVADADVYLTYEGAIIWNISESGYTVDLNKGKNNGYGLLLRAKAPSVVTGVDQIDAKAGAQKVIIDEHVFILRGGQMYDVNGKMVK